MKRKITPFICIVTSLLFPLTLSAQQAPVLKPNWYNLDLKTDSVFGISIDKAYAELLKGKQPKKVIVAVIDGGLDVEHEDLKQSVWTNPKEIPGNGKDDDKNGYIDDIHGWNFLGSATESFEYTNDPIAAEVRIYKARFGDKDSTAIAQKDLPDFRKYIARRTELEDKLKKLNQEIASTNFFLTDVNSVLKRMGKENPSLDDFKNFVPTNAAEAKAQSFMVPVLKKDPDFKAFMDKTKADLESKTREVQYRLNIDYDPRAKYEKEYALAKGRFYGNPNVGGPVPPAHGTHVAGIIAAIRNNNIGINGVADAVEVMPVRAIPDGDALERDMANAIRYAADNGAGIINMSFGLSAVTDRELMVNAVKYALSKGVLFIQAAGNGNDNLADNGYPNRASAADKYFADAFIKVGASGFTDDEKLMVPFSNFGQTTVDVFAPGLGINSTIPGNKYEAHSGTSMAAPVVSGMAAVIRAYYPKLTAVQVKEIIMKSVQKRDALKDKCISGGVINAYEAIKLAASY